MNEMKHFLLNFLGNERAKGEFVYSTKKFFFVIASACAYIVPLAMLAAGSVKGPEVLGFWQIIVPATIGVYTAGKWIEK